MKEEYGVATEKKKGKDSINAHSAKVSSFSEMQKVE
jgi:hypothetical protein